MINRLLSTTLATWLSVIPLGSCLSGVSTPAPKKGSITQVQSTNRLTRLNLSQITFNDNISYLSPSEQARYRRYKAEFFQSLKHLPPKEQTELKEAYKWVPDVIKIIASRDYQDRKEYIQEFNPGSKFYSTVMQALYNNRQRMSKSIEVGHVVYACHKMIRFRYPLKMLDIENQSIEDTAKKCGFGNLAKMVDFCNDPKNNGKFYNKSVDQLTFSRTIEEIEAFKEIGSKYEKAIWDDFLNYPYFYIYKFWKFDLKRVDTSNLTPVEYAKMERQLKCVPPEILINCRYKTYDSRMGKKNCIAILGDPTYIKMYAQKKGIRLSAQEVREVHQLASEILKYGTPLKLVKRDKKTDLGTIAKNFGFHKVDGFLFYYNRKKKNNIKVQFCGSNPEKIPYFIEQAKDFYDLGMVVNPEGTKELYHNIEVDTGIVIPHRGIAPNVSNDHHVDAPQKKSKKVPSGGGAHENPSPRHKTS